jgi:hypothetical protein
LGAVVGRIIITGVAIVEFRVSTNGTVTVERTIAGFFRKAGKVDVVVYGTVSII